MARKATSVSAGHRLDGADAEARRRRDDLLLAGDQRDLVGADARDDAVVDLAGEEAERQADHAGGVAEHPLDGEMGLAGIGRSEDGDHVAAADGRAHPGFEEHILWGPVAGLAPGAASNLCTIAARRRGEIPISAKNLNTGTSLEQNRSESLTRASSRSVHHDIWPGYAHCATTFRLRVGIPPYMFAEGTLPARWRRHRHEACSASWRRRAARARPRRNASPE